MCQINATVSDRQCAINHLRGLVEEDGTCTPCPACKTGKANRRKYPHLTVIVDRFSGHPIVAGNPLPRTQIASRAARPRQRQPQPPPAQSLAELRDRIKEDWR